MPAVSRYRPLRHLGTGPQTGRRGQDLVKDEGAQSHSLI